MRAVISNENAQLNISAPLKSNKFEHTRLNGRNGM